MITCFAPLTIHSCPADPTDSRSYLTVADKRAQQVILDAVLAEWPELCIVAEEDEQDEGWCVPEEYRNALDKTLFEGEKAFPVPKELQDLPLSDVCLFIDPVDGTREFVQGRLLSVCNLIGVSVRGRSVAGVIGLPFHDEQCTRDASPQAAPPSSASGVTLYALGETIGGLGTIIENEAAEGRSGEGGQQQRWKTATSAKVKDPSLIMAQHIVDSCTTAPLHLVAGGCGNKIVRLLTGEADVAMFNLGTSVWDTCATEVRRCEDSVSSWPRAC
jgi:3'(2'), 5'-bisphosphate nucleotidase